MYVQLKHIISLSSLQSLSFLQSYNKVTVLFGSLGEGKEKEGRGEGSVEMVCFSHVYNAFNNRCFLLNVYFTLLHVVAV